MENDTITRVPGIEVGHATDRTCWTGCTVVICRKGAVCGVDVRGAAPGTRETDLLRPGNLVEEVHAVLLTGGSAFGLAAADGVMRWLEEQGIGFDTGVARVPIVPAAVLFDLAVGDPKARPDAEMGYAACQAASAEPVPEGNVGAGTGATVGKLLGMRGAMKAGIGSACVSFGGIHVGALIAVNAFGDVIDPQSGQILAGTRDPRGGFLDTARAMRGPVARTLLRFVGNTVIGVVATNARLDKGQATRVAAMAHDGLARTISPAHTMWDGDTLFVLSTAKRKADVSVVGAAAAEAVERAVLRAVQKAEGVDSLSLPAWRDIQGA